jgi:hypothetical protein
MAAISHPLAVGGPNLVSGHGWDPAPFMLMLFLVILMRWARIPTRGPALLGAAAGALLIDLTTDAFDISLFTISALLTLCFWFVALWRTPRHRPHAQQV